jgi:hypothetical protein
MKLQEGGRSVAGTSRNFAGVRPLGDAEQQADHQIAPQQPGELLGKFDRAACEQSGRLGLGHEFTQGRTGCLSSDRIERTRHFGGLGYLGNSQPEYRNDRGVGYLADEFGARVSKRELYALVGNKQEMLIACISERSRRLDAPTHLPELRDLETLAQVLASFGAGRDLKRAGSCVAALHERRKGRLKDALAQVHTTTTKRWPVLNCQKLKTTRFFG